MNSYDKYICNLCLSESIDELGDLGNKAVSVKSDSKICSLGARIYMCHSCSHLQKFYAGPQEISAIDATYKDYAPHHLSCGNEQPVFPEGHLPRPRTYHILEKCVEYLPKCGRLLDIGAGNGSFLKSASKLLADWKLHAFDISDAQKKEILEIPQVEEFFCGEIDEYKRTGFDLVVLWHALEHVPNPVSLLSSLKSKIKEGGYLLVQVPDVQRNPFDLGVIDHCSHFTAHSLSALFRSLGFKTMVDGYDWTHNCLTLLLQNENSSASINRQSLFAAKKHNAEIYFYWVNKTIKDFEDRVKNSEYAIFGTGMASLWLFGQLSRRALFFVDEDKLRLGNQIEGISIIGPESITTPAPNLLMPFIYSAGVEISKRLKKIYPNLKPCNFLLAGQL